MNILNMFLESNFRVRNWSTYQTGEIGDKSVQIN